MQISQSHIDTCKSLFRGRDDVYAVRWEKDGRGGYIPACKVDWDDYNKYKASGGTFASYTKKEYLPFNDTALKEHFSGKLTVGIYPLLQDNTSFFIAPILTRKIGKNPYSIYMKRVRKSNCLHI